MSESKDSQKEILKATSLFGGVQIISIVISILRSKFIAIFLGPAGMGISGMLTATIGLISALTNFGLGTSAVRDIAKANETKDTQSIAKVVTVFRKLVWFTGGLGALVCFFTSYYLSEITFGNKNYTWAFVILSITLLIDQLTRGRAVLMQGMRQLRYMAKASVIGSLFGLFISLPIYYLYGLDGIVPTLLLSSFLAYIIEWYFSRKIKIENVTLAWSEVWEQGRGMLQLGIMLSLNSLIVLAVSYIIRLFIAKTGGIEDVGFYNAGFAIINTYVGLIFTAMSSDYFPRLSEVVNNQIKANLIINQQGEVAMLILSPILVGFIIFINFVVVILYSKHFIPIQGMLHWAALGMYFKTLGWLLGYLVMAKGEPKVFFWNELIVNSYLLILNLLGFYYWGLEGLGISFMLGYIFYFIQVYCLSRSRYGFVLSKSLLKIAFITISFGLVSFFVAFSFTSFTQYFFGGLLFIIALGYSFFELSKILNFNLLSKLKK